MKRQSSAGPGDAGGAPAAPTPPARGGGTSGGGDGGKVPPGFPPKLPPSYAALLTAATCSEHAERPFECPSLASVRRQIESDVKAGDKILFGAYFGDGGKPITIPGGMPGTEAGKAGMLDKKLKLRFKEFVDASRGPGHTPLRTVASGVIAANRLGSGRHAAGSPSGS